ncbi:type IV secretion protein Rhs, partial [Pseudomonas sp. SDO524_S393]
MNPAIGRLALTPMTVKTVDVERVFSDFRGCLNTFDEWAERFWSFSALEVEQVFKVGNEVALVAPASSKKLSPVVALCEAQGSMTLVHMFESTQFVPIGNTPVRVQAIATDGSPMGAPTDHIIGPSGILEIKNCTRDQKYQITFYPNVSRDHVRALYASYQSVIAELEERLREAWTDIFQDQWKTYSNAGPLDQRRMLETAFLRGMGKALYNLWDNVTQLYDLLLHIQPNSEKLLQYLSETELDELLTLDRESIAKGLLVLSDEPLLFIYLSAIASWIRLLPPQEMNEVMGEITGEVLINLLLIRAIGAMGVTVRLGKQVVSQIKSDRARQLLELLDRQLVGPELQTHAETAKPLLLGSTATPIKVIPDVPLKAGDEL